MIACCAPLSAMEAAADVSMCACCQQDLKDGTPVEALTCGHVFHTECIERNMQVHGKPRAELPCPVCKTVAVATVEDPEVMVMRRCEIH